MKNLFFTLTTTGLIFMSLNAFSSNLEIPYEVETNPKNLEVNWDVEDVVEILNGQLGNRFQDDLDRLTESDLLPGVAFFDKAIVRQYMKDPIKEKSMSLELTRRLFNIPLADFLDIIPAHDWGLYLNKLEGRGISDVTLDDKKRVIEQVERMVLTTPWYSMNMDMTKVEVIKYEENAKNEINKVTVSWRVFYSKNKSTLADIGSVEFENVSGKTLVTFRSAHSLGTNRLFPIPMPNIPYLQEKIADTFLDHLENYSRILDQ